jgi:hypothetical protein
MRLNRRAAGALGAGALLLAGGGAALAASGEGGAGAGCDQRLARAAEKSGVSVEQLKADIQGRLLARIDAAETAGRISPERAAMLRERVNEGSLCGARRHVRARIARHGLLGGAAAFLRLDREQLRAQLPGHSRPGRRRREDPAGPRRHAARPAREARGQARDEGVPGGELVAGSLPAAARRGLSGGAPSAFLETS